MSAIGTTAIRGSGRLVLQPSALLHLGFIDEAVGLSTWIRDRIEERAGRDGPPLSIMYRVDGSSDSKEESLDHLDGYMGSRPVRIGNGAADQLQLDIYGEAIDSIQALDKIVPCIGDRGWRDLARMIDWLWTTGSSQTKASGKHGVAAVRSPTPA